MHNRTVTVGLATALAVLALVAVGCGSGTPPGDGGDSSPTAAGRTTESRPAAGGSPLDIAIFNVRGQPYASNEAYIQGEVKRACGGSSCVRVVVVYNGPRNKKCGVTDIDQPTPTYAGDTITFTLGKDCGDTSAPETTTSTSTSRKTTTTTSSSR